VFSPLLKRRAALHAEFRHWQIHRATVWANDQAITTLKTKLGTDRIYGLTIGAAHGCLSLPLSFLFLTWVNIYFIVQHKGSYDEAGQRVGVADTLSSLIIRASIGTAGAF
jgi:hypothetical protein